MEPGGQRTDAIGLRRLPKVGLNLPVPNTPWEVKRQEMQPYKAVSLLTAFAGARRTALLPGAPYRDVMGLDILYR